MSMTEGYLANDYDEQIVVASWWDEPPLASSPRGWFFQPDGSVTGFFLDYGPDNYRSGHDRCRGVCHCRSGQPGDILACRYVAIGSVSRESHYCETVEQARAFVEAGFGAAI
jgi:hypothetical protein